MPAMKYGLDQRTTQETSLELLKLQQELALAAQRRAEAEQAAELKRQQAATADKIRMEAILADPIAKQKLDLQQAMVANRRDVRSMSPAEESGFLGGGEPLGGGIEAMRPRSGVPLGPMVGPPAGQGGIDRGTTAPSFSQPQTISNLVPRVRGGKPRITEGQSASPRRSRGPVPIAEGSERQPSGDIELTRRPSPELRGVTADQPRRGPTVRSRTAFTDRDTPMTEIRQQAERVRDPNFPTVFAAQEASARLDPRVLASENDARAAMAVAGGRRTGLTPSIASAIRNARGAIDQLKERDPAMTQQTGPRGILEGVGQRIQGAVGLDETATVYGALGERLIPALARSAGEVGNLAEKEQARYQKLVPRVTDPLNVRQAKIAAIDELIDLVERGSGGTALIARMDAFEQEVGGGTGAPSGGVDWVYDPSTGKFKRPGGR